MTPHSEEASYGVLGPFTSAGEFTLGGPLLQVKISNAWAYIAEAKRRDLRKNHPSHQGDYGEAELELTAEVLRLAAQQEPIECKALIDTGACLSLIDEHLVEKLQPPVKFGSTRPMHLVGQKIPVSKSYKYPIEIDLADGGAPLIKTVPSLSLELKGVDLLIGVDILKEFEFFVDGPSGSFVLKRW